MAHVCARCAAELAPDDGGMAITCAARTPRSTRDSEVTPISYELCCECASGVFKFLARR